MLALLYRATSKDGVFFMVATSREAAAEEVKELVEDDSASLEYLGRVANLSLDDEETTEEEINQPIQTLQEVFKRQS